MKLVKWLFWNLLALTVSMPLIRGILIELAEETPYWHLEGYMKRWWLFNRYDLPGGARWKWLPSVRIHHILRKDLSPHLHDHPWNARTIILEGFYEEIRQVPNPRSLDGKYLRQSGDTASLNFEEYRHISYVSPGGVWTMFFTFGYLGTWGFLVDGKKVKHSDRPNEFKKP